MEEMKMVSNSVIAAVCVTLFISLVLPVALYLVYGIKNKGKGVWTAWLLGAAGFFVFQIVIRIPLLNLLSLNEGFRSFAASHYILYCLALAFTAGLFEAAGRYAVARILKKKLSFERGFAAGLGHGGIEAILLIGITYINNLLYIMLINTGAFEEVVSQAAALGSDISPLLQLQSTLLSSGPLMFYLAGYERILTMVFHVFLSLLVCYSVRNGKDLQGLLICLLLHTAVDFAAPMLNGLASPALGNRLSASTAYLLVYILLTAVAIACAAGILSLRKRWKQSSSEA